MKKLFSMLSMVAFALAATTSFAAVRASHVFTANQTVPFAGALVVLNNAGQNTVAFNAPSAGKKVLTYSAECRTQGTSVGWAHIDIIVNGNVVAPTAGTTDAFCSTGDGWTRGSITVAIQVVAGANTVSIRAASGAAAVTNIALGDTSLVVHD